MLFKKNTFYLWTIGCGVFSAFSAYIYFSWMSNIKPKTIISREKNEIEIYNKKYIDKFDKLEAHELSKDFLNGLKNNIIMEMTPRGNIVMYYDHDTETFVYYSDRKDIPYSFLETLVRKYAITYNCKKIIIDIREELIKAKKKMDEEQEGGVKEVNKKHSKSEETIFANLKKYNRKGTGGNKVDNKKYLLMESANRYSYKGKIENFSFITPNTEKNTKDKKIDYETFKKLMKKN